MKNISEWWRSKGLDVLAEEPGTQGQADRFLLSAGGENVDQDREEDIVDPEVDLDAEDWIGSSTEADA